MKENYKKLINDLLDNYFDNYSIKSIEHLTHGWDNTTFIVTLNFKKVVIRFWGKKHPYMGKRSIQDIMYELKLMEFYFKHQLPIPPIILSVNNEYFNKIQGVYYAVIEYVEGETPSNFSVSMIGEIASTMALMHKLSSKFRFPTDRNWPGSIFVMTEKRYNDFSKLIQGSFEKGRSINFLKKAYKNYQNIVAKIDLRSIPHGPIHGDIIADNVKFLKNRLVGIFDFDDCRDSYFIEDISKSLLFDFDSPSAGLWGKSDVNIQTFIKEYQKVRPFTQKEIIAFPIILEARFLYELLRQFTLYLNGNLNAKKRINNLISRHTKFHNYFVVHDNLK